MPIPVLQTTAQSITVWFADSADGKTGKTGLVGAMTIGLAKYGDTSFTTITPTVTEIAGGHYKVDLTTTHMNVVGLTSIRITATGADPCDLPNIIDVVAYDKTSATRGTSGTALPAVASGSAGAIPTTGTGANQIAVDGAGNAKSDVNKWLAGTIPAVNVTGVPLVDAKYLLGTVFPTPTVAGVPNVNTKTWNDLVTVALPLIPTTAGRTLDVSATGEAGLDWANIGSPTSVQALSQTSIKDATDITTNLATAQTAITAIKTKTDNLPADTATTLGTLATASSLSTAQTAITAIKTKTDNLPADTATVLGTLATGTNLATAQTAITAIKAKTDNLPSDPADASDIAALFSTAAATQAAIKAKTDNLPSDPADASDIAAEFALVATAASLATAQTAITAIKAKTDNLPSDPADASDIAAEFALVATAASLATAQTAITAIKAKTDNLPSDPADASDIAALFAANAATLALVKANTDLIPVIGGLLHLNSKIDKTIYVTGFLTSARLRVFADATALAAATGVDPADDAESEIYRFTITGVDEGDGTVKTYKLARNL